ncbi:MAG: tRNA (adenosine(37)-N6)-threonylcarbamoyltransferase complex dimerization subunit type 1 TsaB [Holophagales bacterium]|jgi:tRNA threonylcarbamoyladenosine biosynthesis protein TsaB|nr:tRNA (adenosine(37)-N6)-threonylcarbamoyltransferase complex dimerization subunit type 1 TsaB [Holophagales bacterium]
MILGIDTATEWLHLALVGSKSAWIRRVLTKPTYNASMALLPLADEIFREADADRNDVSGVVACVGPGGFTSLRVGIATAEGFAVAGLSTWGFTAFELRALSLSNQVQSGVVYVVLDGQRGEVFLQPWDMEKRQSMKPAAKVPINELALAIGDNDWWAPERFRPKAASYMCSSPITLEDEGLATLDALVELCRVCSKRPLEDQLLPLYLRETDAEVKFPAASAHLKDMHRRGLAR